MAKYVKNYGKGNRHKIAELILACGGVPLKALELIEPIHLDSFQHSLRMMERENVLEYYHENEIWVIGFNQEIVDDFDNKDEIIHNFSDELLSHYYQYGKKDWKRLRYTTNLESRQRARRTMRNNECLLFMKGCNIPCLPGENKKNAIALSRALYLSTRELRQQEEPGIDETEINGKKLTVTSRMNGMVSFQNNGSYNVINTDAYLYQYSYISEKKATLMGEKATFDYALANFKGCVLLYKDILVVQQLIKPKISRDKTENHTNITKRTQYANNLLKAYEGFEIMALPLSPLGQKLLNMMKENKWQERLIDATIPPELIQGKRGLVECDGQDGNQYYLVFCIPNIIRLKNFLRSAESDEDSTCTYYIYCFDYQLEFLKSVAIGNIKLRCIRIDDAIEILKD